MSDFETIVNHQLVVEAFGQWPSFHDGEVHRIVLDRMRQLPSGSHYPSIELFVRGWIMTSEVTNAGFYKQEHDSIVHFLFEQVTDLELDGLNHQNVLSSLDFEVVSGTESGSSLLSVELSHCYGLSGGFKALRASVVSVKPYAC
jgi:Immunity protein 50